MLTPAHMQAMRDEMQKLSTRSAQGEHEEMSKARFKQTLKDLPIVVGGSALGYGLGKTLGDLGAQKLVKSTGGREAVRNWAPAVGSALSAAGAYTLGQQRAIMRERRDKAEEKAQKKQASVAPMADAYLVANPSKPRSDDRNALAQDTESKPVIRRPAHLAAR